MNSKQTLSQGETKTQAEIINSIPVYTKKPWQSKNFWTNLGSIVVSLITYFSTLELDPSIGGDVYDMISQKNWPLLLITAFNLVNMIVQLAKKKADKETIQSVVIETMAKARAAA